MKRQMLVLVLISSVLLAACGGPAAPATNQPTAAPAPSGDATAAPAAAGGDATAGRHCLTADRRQGECNLVDA